SAAQGSASEIQSLAADLVQAVEALSGNDKWKLAAVYSGKYGAAHRAPWDALVQFVRQVHRDAAQAQESFLKFGPKVPDDPAPEDQERVASQILAHLENGGKLGSIALLTHKSWKNFIESTKVNNVQPRKPEHFQALRQLLRLQMLRNDLA